jgi:hypothetical protein
MAKDARVCPGAVWLGWSGLAGYLEGVASPIRDAFENKIYN